MNIEGPSKGRNIFTGIDKRGQINILSCLRKIADTFADGKSGPLPISTLVELERHVGQYHVTPVLNAVGIKIEGDKIHITEDFGRLQDTLRNLENSPYTPVEPDVVNPFIARFRQGIEEVLANIGIQDAKDHI